jgi:hypothetical protein
MKRCAARLVTTLLLAVSALPALANGQVRAQKSVVRCPLVGPVDRPLLRVFESADQWQSETRADERATFGREVRWARERVVVFALEQQPTLGVQVELNPKRVVVRGGMLRLPIQVRRPGADEMAATALSRPCVMIAVRRGGWRKVTVLDAKARVLVEGNLSALSEPSGATPPPPDLRDVVVSPSVPTPPR